MTYVNMQHFSINSLNFKQEIIHLNSQTWIAKTIYIIH